MNKEELKNLADAINQEKQAQVLQKRKEEQAKLEQQEQLLQMQDEEKFNQFISSYEKICQVNAEMGRYGAEVYILSKRDYKELNYNTYGLKINDSLYSASAPELNYNNLIGLGKKIYDFLVDKGYKITIYGFRHITNFYEYKTDVSYSYEYKIFVDWS